MSDQYTLGLQMLTASWDWLAAIPGFVGVVTAAFIVGLASYVIKRITSMDGGGIETTTQRMEREEQEVRDSGEEIWDWDD
jgi:hypothetical protein